ncbi:MAG: hypothetical protein ACFFD2_24615, partial [Promethearchaeota archaeon]
MAEIEGAIKDKIETALTLIKSCEYQKAIDFLLDIIDFFVEVGDFEERDKFLLKITECFRFLAMQYRDKQDYFEAAETFISAAFLQKQHDKNKKAHQLFNEAIDCFAYASENAISKNFYKEASILYCSAAKYAKDELCNKSKSKNFYQNAIDA